MMIDEILATLAVFLSAALHGLVADPRFCLIHRCGMPTAPHYGCLVFPARKTGRAGISDGAINQLPLAVFNEVRVQ
jgi:hypothetical protein